MVEVEQLIQLLEATDTDSFLSTNINKCCRPIFVSWPLWKSSAHNSPYKALVVLVFDIDDGIG